MEQESQKLNTKDYYEDRIEKFGNRIEQFNKKFSRISWLRLLFFLLAAILIIYSISIKVYWIGGIGVISFFAFIYLIRRHQKINKRKKFLQELINVNNNELVIQDYAFEKFDTGEDFLYSEHPYARDLDLFGRHSVFQFLNRTFSAEGRKKLATWLKNSELKPGNIEKRQSAIKDISNRINWRQNFQVSGNLSDIEKDSAEKIKEWTKTTAYFKDKKVLYYLIYILPVFTVLSIILAIPGIVITTVPLLLVAVQMTISGLYAKKIKAHHEQLNNKFKFLEAYKTLLQYIEDENFEAENLNAIKALISKDEKKASEKIDNLAKNLYYLDLRTGLVTGPVLNVLFNWDLHCIFRLENWLQQNGEQVEYWFDAVSEMEVYVSLAAYAFNNPGYVYPEFNDEDGNFLIAQEAGHPAIEAKERVNNSFFIKDHTFAIVTGSNMAGKSTFLRTIGINMIMATLGVNVCASLFRFRPVKIMTSMRTDDSLVKHESLFYAELKRLQMINEELKKGEEVFVILDEILKGTNSHDKLKGSYAFVKNLVNYNCQGIIATHDLGIAELQKEIPDKYNNYHFDSIVEGNEVYYDYKLKNGVCQNFNATHLMKQMGILEYD